MYTGWTMKHCTVVENTNKIENLWKDLHFNGYPILRDFANLCRLYFFSIKNESSCIYTNCAKN